MWWKFKKKIDTDAEVVYAYSYESNDLSGEIAYNKETGAIVVRRRSDAEFDPDSRRPRRWMRELVKGGSFPDTRLFAIG